MCLFFLSIHFGEKHNRTIFTTIQDVSFHYGFNMKSYKNKMICCSKKTQATAHLLVPFVCDPLDLDLFPTHDAL